MGNIFAPAGQTGATGGVRQARQDFLNEEGKRLSNEGQEITNKTKQEEFWDYVDATEHRQKTREAEMSESQTTIDTEDTRTEKTTQEQMTEAEVAKANRELIPAKKQNELNKIHQQMDDRQYDNVTRAYKFFDEGIKSGRTSDEEMAQLYDQARQGIMQSFPDPQKGAAWLESFGVGAKFSKQSINALGALSTYGLHDAGTARQEHLLDVEWDRKIQEARIGAAGKKATDLTTKFLSADERGALGNMYSSYGTVTGDKWFEDLQGGQDDSGNWTGSKGAVVDTVALWSTTAQRDGILGDPNVHPFDYQRIAGDIMSMARSNYTEDGLFWGSNNTGDDFHGNAFMNAAGTAMSHLENERAALSAAGVDMPVYEIWKLKGPQIMAKMSASHRAMVKNGQTPATGSPKVGSQSGEQGGDETPTPSPKTTHRPVAEINADISVLVKANKKGSNAWKKLLEERRASRASKRTPLNLGDITGKIIDFTTTSTDY